MAEMIWPRVPPGPLQASIETSAIPVTLDLVLFEAVGSDGIPDESSMKSEPCVRFDAAEKPSAAACVFGIDENAMVRLYVPSPSTYVVIAATWYPRIGSDAENVNSEVGATWGMTSQRP